MTGSGITRFAHGAPRARPRRDGYSPLACHLAQVSYFRQPPEPVAKLAVRSAVRLDAAHRLVERLRVALDRVNRLQPASNACETARFEAIGAAEVAITALYRAFNAAQLLGGRAGRNISVSFPALVERDLHHLDDLRNFCEHIEGDGGKRRSPTMTAWYGVADLFKARALRHKDWSLSIDLQLTKRMDSVRKYILSVWIACSKAKD